MSYSAERDLDFARKYRPNNFKVYVGNETEKKKLFSSMKTGKFPQVILITGPSGTGKTTISRLVIKEYSCDNRDLENGACGVCESCKAIDDYILTGVSDWVVEHVKEIDIGENSKASDLDDMIEDVNIPSFDGKFKIYFLDEFHNASSKQQERLLKITEEPPENVLFIFGTTNPEQLKKTILTRCRLKLRITKPKISEMAGFLRGVCMNEGVEYDIKGLNLIAMRSEMVFREALGDLETAIGFGGSAKYTDIVSMYDELSNDILFSFYKHLLNRDVLAYVTLLHKIKTTQDLSIFLKQLYSFTQTGLYVLNGADIDGVTDGEMKAYKALFSRFTLEQVCTLLGKLLSIKTKDTELLLLELGYTGLSRGVITEQESVGKSELESIENEVTQEMRQTVKNKNVQLEEHKERSLETAKVLQQDASFDAIQSLFGSVEVVD